MPRDPSIISAPASLRFSSCHSPGIRRLPRGRGFSYLLPSNKPVTSPATLARIRSIVIPPAWTDVWICPDPRGHLQATGLDARSRRQYRYHPRWSAHRNLSKFAFLAQFASVLPRIRRRIRADLALSDLPRDKVLACIVHIMDTAHLRVGNAEYARDNHSYGLTTILNRHASVAGATVRFRFRAKSGKMCDVALEHPAIARIVRQCQDLPGQELFTWLDERGRAHDITSSDVNDYLRRITSHPVTAKDFRTWHGTVIAARTLTTDFARPISAKTLSKAEHKRRALAAVRAASTALNNTPATCRKFYIHPQVFAAMESTELWKLHDAAHELTSPRLLSREERMVVMLISEGGRKRLGAVGEMRSAAA